MQYQLRVHSVDLLTSSGLDKHTGFDLVVIDDNRKARIYTIDLTSKNGKIVFNYSEEEAHIVHLKKQFSDNISQDVYWSINDSQETLDSVHAYTNIIMYDDNALEAFQKIKLNATILNLYSDSLTYDILKRNCNTSTQYFSDLYLNGQDVFNDLPGHYQGKDSNFNDYILDDGQPVVLTNYYIDMSSSLA